MVKKEEEQQEEETDELDSRDGFESEEGREFDSGGSDDDEVIAIEDPHLSVEQRRREIEDEMSEGEREVLRPDWKAFLVQAVASAARRDEGGSRRPGPSRPRSNASGSSSKRVRTSFTPTTPIYVPDSDDELPPPKRSLGMKDEPDSPKPAVRAPVASSSRQPYPSSSNALNARALVRDQRLRALGLAPTTLSRTPHAANGRSTMATVKLDDGTDGWACAVCSLKNLISRTRCGEWLQA